MASEYKLFLRKDTGRTYVKAGRKLGDNVNCSCPQSVFSFLETKYHLTEEAEEKVYLMCLNTKCKLIGVFLVSQGTVNASLLSPRSVFLRALLVGASNIVLVHNHPSQVTEPSRDDETVTKRISDAGKLIDIKLLDHIIVGEGYYSFKQENKLD